MNQNQAEELVTVLRRVMAPEDGLPPGVGGDFIRALRTELEPFIRLASVPYCEYMNEKAAAIYCSTPVATLQRKRSEGKGPVYIKDGAKVLYARKDLDRYMAARKVKTYEQS